MTSGELGPDETFESLRFLAHAGAPCPPAIKRATMDRVRPGALWEFYGSTEGQFTVCSPDDWLAHPGTVGRARPGRRLSVTSLDGERDEGDGSGTVWCDMPSFGRFRYFGNDAATEEAWRGTACTVGDLGRLDADGFLYLTGRRHDLIISGGVNVYPAEIEATLSAVHGIKELAVFALPDERWGQAVCVAYVADRSLDDDQLRRVAESNLAPYKRPKLYVRAADLPHTATGKILRRSLPDYLGLGAMPGGGTE